MNYLAHAYLSANDPGNLIGNLAVDFLRGGVTYQDASIVAGIERHRLIDQFTDSHPCFRASRERVSPPHHRYSPVVVDIFYDHFLAANWERFAGQSLLAFSEWTYGILQAHEDMLPARLVRALPYMVKDNWMLQYAEIDGIRQALNGLSRRARRDIDLVETIADLENCYEVIASDFNAFFPELIEAVRPLGGDVCGELALTELTTRKLTAGQ